MLTLQTLISSLQAKLRWDGHNQSEVLHRLHQLATVKSAHIVFALWSLIVLPRGNEALMEALEIIDGYESQNIDLQAELDVARVGTRLGTTLVYEVHRR
jgi:hypothetical protein